MSEMAITADHLIVIGKGRLIADTTVEDFLRRSSGNYVRVRSPQVGELTRLAAAEGWEATPQPDGAVAVSGVAVESVGALAAAHGLVLHELSPQQASLEEAFMELTKDFVDYRADAATPTGQAER